MSRFPTSTRWVGLDTDVPAPGTCLDIPPVLEGCLFRVVPRCEVTALVPSLPKIPCDTPRTYVITPPETVVTLRLPVSPLPTLRGQGTTEEGGRGRVRPRTSSSPSVVSPTVTSWSRYGSTRRRRTLSGYGTGYARNRKRTLTGVSLKISIPGIRSVVSTGGSWAVKGQGRRSDVTHP